MLRAAAKNWHRTGGVTVVDRSRRLRRACWTRSTRTATHDLPIPCVSRMAAQGLRAHRRLRRRDRRTTWRASKDRRPRRTTRRAPPNTRACSPVQMQQGTGPALRREPAPDARRSIATAQRPVGAAARLRATAGQGALATTTSPTPTPRWGMRARRFDVPACVDRQARQPLRRGRSAADAPEAYRKAFKTDPTSAFGGIIAFNRTVDVATAQAVGKQFVEVLMAPAYTTRRARWSCWPAKHNVRVLESLPPPTGTTASNATDVKRVGGGLLVQTADEPRARADPSSRSSPSASLRRSRDAATCCSPGRSPGT